MNSEQENQLSRREFLSGLTLAGTAAFLGLKSGLAAAEPPPETTRIRIHDAPITCFAPVYLAEPLLKAEGFTEIEYVKTPLAEGPTKALAEGKIDITQNDTAGHLMVLDAGGKSRDPRGHPHRLLGALRERFGTHAPRSEGQDASPPQNAAAARHSSPVWQRSWALIQTRTSPGSITSRRESMRLFAEGKIDAFMGFAPEPQELAGEEDRTRPGQFRDGSAVVPVLLLPRGREPRVRAEESGRDEAGAAGNPEGDGPVRQPAGAVPRA